VLGTVGEVGVFVGVVVVVVKLDAISAGVPLGAAVA
jgi:hypothetical protein